jgi:hypothetical protein
MGSETAEDGDSSSEPQLEEYEITWKPSHRRAFTLIAVVLVTVVALGSLVVILPYLTQESSGPAPVWHRFDGVLDADGLLVSESCSLQNVPEVLNGIAIGRPLPTSTVICSYHGATYTGYYGKDCSLIAAGPMLSVNGTLVSFGGCELSLAPLNYILAGIFRLGSRSNHTIAIYSNQRIIANLTPAGNWTTYHCSISANNVTKANGPLKCIYLGVPYTAPSVLQNCNLGTPIQVNGVTVPRDSCNLERSEIVTG